MLVSAGCVGDSAAAAERSSTRARALWLPRLLSRGLGRAKTFAEGGPLLLARTDILALVVRHARLHRLVRHGALVLVNRPQRDALRGHARLALGR